MKEVSHLHLSRASSVQPSSTRRAVSAVRIKWNKTKSKLKRCRCQRLLSSLAVHASSRFIFSFFFLFFFLLVFGFFHSAFAFVIKWNLARRLAALNASQCAAIFISFNAHTNRLRERAQAVEGRGLWGLGCYLTMGKCTQINAIK